MGALLLFGTGLALAGCAAKVKKTSHRIYIIEAILVVLLLVWAELAVGIFGTVFAGS